MNIKKYVWVIVVFIAGISCIGGHGIKSCKSQPLIMPQTLIVKTTCYSTGKHVSSKPYSHPRPEWIAISHKLEKIFPMFSYIKVCGKVYQVRDRMPYPRWKDYRLDIFRETKKECVVWGIKKCKVEKVKWQNNNVLTSMNALNYE